MRNLIIATAILILSFFNGLSSIAQSRYIFWVHGMNDNASRFEYFDNYFSSRYYMYSYRDYYTTYYGIPNSATSLSYDIYSATDKKNIVIAHSMGGVNSLYIYKNLGGRNKIGGLISFNSLYNGAYIANNLDNGTMTNIVNEAIDKGALGARNDPGVAVASFMSIGNINIAMALNIYHVVLETLIKNIPNYVKNFASQYIATSTKNSIKVGSSDIAGIQSVGGTDLPSIAFYGNEDYPACLKQIKSLTGQNIESLISGIANGCNSLYEAHNTARIICLAALQFPQAAYHGQMASNWKTSKDYWSSTFQKATNVMIGAYRTELQTITYQEWQCVYDDPYKSTAIAIPECEYQWVTVTKTVSVVVEEPSDGLLPITTQMALPGCLRKFELLHINHEEVTSSTYARDRLGDVFNRTIYTNRDPEFFRLTSR